MKAMERGRKGISIGTWPVLLIVTVIGITALGIGVQFIYTLTGDLGANSDRESLNTLGERTQNKCDAVLEGTETEPLVVEGLGFEQIESLSVEEVGEEGSYRYAAEFSDQNPAYYDISGCSLELTQSAEPGTWDFTIEKGQENNHLVVEVEQR